VIDLDGVSDPRRPNDRLLLGMKGSISEFERGGLRARMPDAARARARRGERRISVPIGYGWHRDAGLGLDPDLRVQEAIRLIFAGFRQLGSARQVLLSMAPPARATGMASRSSRGRFCSRATTQAPSIGRPTSGTRRRSRPTRMGTRVARSRGAADGHCWPACSAARVAAAA
jgi:hypothetical protein